MWTKDEKTDDQTDPGRTRPPKPRGSTERRSPPEQAAIGAAITVRGEVTGDEDLLIQGRVEGTVDLQQHAVVVGPDGHVQGDVTARIVTVQGTVEGDLDAEEQAILRASARVRGDITAPRVVLEDGARFRGGIDMGEAPSPTRPHATASVAGSSSSPKPSKTPDE